MSRTLGLGLLFVLTMSFIGCGGSSSGGGITFKGNPPTETPDKSTPTKEATTQPANGEPATAGEGPVVANAATQRRIIYSGTMIVEVADFAVAHKNFTELLRQSGAFLAQTDITADAGRARSGTFTIKVPVEHFQTLIDALAAMGNPIKNKTDSQDVTEEYVDVAARVKNLKAEEEVLNKMLKDVGSKLEEVFRIREQIKNNRGEIEKLEGRLQTISKVTAVSTIVLTMREIGQYVAPTAPKPPEKPVFSSRAAEAWSISLGHLQAIGEWFGIAAIRLVPWVPFMVIAYLGYRIGRNKVRKYQPTKA